VFRGTDDRKKEVRRRRIQWKTVERKRVGRKSNAPPRVLVVILVARGLTKPYFSLHCYLRWSGQLRSSQQGGLLKGKLVCCLSEINWISFPMSGSYESLSSPLCACEYTFKTPQTEKYERCVSVWAQ